jgi:hypothetical protein
MTGLGLLGILIGLGLLISFAFRGWSVLPLAPLAALIAALFSREPLPVHWTQTFMVSAASFLAQKMRAAPAALVERFHETDQFSVRLWIASPSARKKLGKTQLLKPLHLHSFIQAGRPRMRSVRNSQ